MNQHRNSQKRFNEEDFIYFITVKTFEGFPYFKEKVFCDLFIEELKLCKKLKGFKLFAFCLNYDHFHLIVMPNDEFNISKVIQFLKKNFSRDVNKIIMEFNKNEGGIPQCRRISKVVERDLGDNMDCRLQNNDNNLLKFLIKKHDKYLGSLKNQFFKKQNPNQFMDPGLSSGRFFQNRFKWQKSYHDHIIRNQKDFYHHLHYTVYNYLKHELPENWKYNSLNFPELIDEY